MKSIPRLSTSPEKLVLAGKTYNLESACARTFLFVGDVVAWSHEPHLLIINGLMKMKNERDLKTAGTYSTRFSEKLDPQGFRFSAIPSTPFPACMSISTTKNTRSISAPDRGTPADEFLFHHVL